MKIKSLAIYCGSSRGNNEVYTASAKQLARLLVTENITVVYGGAKVGIMGAIANEMLIHGGNVIGVIPQSLVNKELAHEGLTDLHVVNSMHERKALIAKLSDGFVMLPGGPGSLDEFFEIFTWGKLSHHLKPFGILNINRYYDLLIDFINHSVNEGFLAETHRDMIQIDDSPENLLRKLYNYCHPEIQLDI